MLEQIKIIDSHHHLWDLSKFEYPWMPTEEGILRRNYLPSDLEPYILDIGKETVIERIKASIQ